MKLAELFDRRSRSGAAWSRDIPRTARDAGQLCHRLLSERGEVSGGRLASEILAIYQSLEEPARGAFFDLLVFDLLVFDLLVFDLLVFDLLVFDLLVKDFSPDSDGPCELRTFTEWSRATKIWPNFNAPWNRPVRSVIMSSTYARTGSLYRVKSFAPFRICLNRAWRRPLFPPM